MYDKIIVALALEHGFSSDAVKVARSLVSESGKIVAVHVSEPVQGVARLYLTDEDVEKAQQTIKTEISNRLTGHEDIEPVILAGHAGREIPDYADKTGADCIVIGSHKPGLEDFFLGSTSARVVRHAKCAVHVLR